LFAQYNSGCVVVFRVYFFWRLLMVMEL
jgi:hypothetical protein